MASVNPVARLVTSSRSPLLQVVKTAVAVVSAVLLCAAILRGPFPTFAAIAALLVVQPSINQSFVKGLERSAGVVLGVLLATGLHLLLGNGTWVVLLVIVLAITLAWALRLTPTSATQVGISGMLVLTAGAVSPAYSVDRIIETLIGAAVALIVNALIVPPVLVGPAHVAVVELVDAVADAFEHLAVGLTEDWDRDRWTDALIEARTLRQRQARANAAIAAGRESLTMNPRGGRQQAVLAQHAAVVGHLQTLVTRAIGMTRAARDNTAPGLAADPVVGRIATELARIAIDVRALGARTGAASVGAGRRGGEADAARPDEGHAPALTAPIPVIRPNSEHWVLIGALLEDIRRVREELLGPGS